MFHIVSIIVCFCLHSVTALVSSVSVPTVVMLRFAVVSIPLAAGVASPIRSVISWGSAFVIKYTAVISAAGAVSISVVALFIMSSVVRSVVPVVSPGVSKSVPTVVITIAAIGAQWWVVFIGVPVFPVPAPVLR